jgi:hypothetical protein
MCRANVPSFLAVGVFARLLSKQAPGPDGGQDRAPQFRKIDSTTKFYYLSIQLRQHKSHEIRDQDYWVSHNATKGRDKAVATKDFKDLLRDAMAEAKLDPPTLARELKVARQTVYKWLSGQLPSHRHARALDARLGLSMFPVSNVRPLPPSSMGRRVPVIEGVPSSAITGACIVDLQPNHWLEADKEISAQAIAFRLGVDAMEPEFYKGEIIIVDPQVEPHNGDYVITEIIERNQESNHELWMFAQYRPRGYLREKPVYDLVPLNPSYKTVTVGRDNPGRIVGTMVEHRRRLQRSKPRD